jgi:hypothetical protein
MSWTIVVHGGAGLILKQALAFPEELYHNTLSIALKAAAALLSSGTYLPHV